MPNATPPVQPHVRICPYCGKQIKGEGKFCKKCVEQGLNHIYEVTGRTNGWDRPKPHYRVVGRKAS